MKDVYYFRHDANAHTDPKLKALRKKYGWEGIGWYWLIIELMRSEEDYLLSYDDYQIEALADDMNCEISRTREYLDYCFDCRLLKKNGTGFYSERLVRDMEHVKDVSAKRSKAGKASAEKRSDPDKFIKGEYGHMVHR